jgi:hypothetical protein
MLLSFSCLLISCGHGSFRFFYRKLRSENPVVLFMSTPIVCYVCGRDLLDINPHSGSKTGKGRKKGVKICPRVVTFLKQFAAFQFKKPAV